MKGLKVLCFMASVCFVAFLVCFTLFADLAQAQPPTGACRLTGGGCQDTTQATCLGEFNGTYMGDGTTCATVGRDVIPAFEHYGLLLFAVLLLASAFWFMRRKKTS